MCIVCNCDDFGNGMPGSKFLSHFERAMAELKKACEEMDKCSKVARRPEVKKQYDMAHKKLVRLRRELAQIEQFREAYPKEADNHANT